MINKITTIEFALLMGFPKPANDNMYSIVLLLSEMTILLTFIFFGVLLALAFIIDVFHALNNPRPRHFEKTVESTLDVLFVIFPTIIIIYLLIPSLGFIFNNETIVETVFNINVIGHQWYWSYEYNYMIGTSLYGLLTNEFTPINQLEFESLLDQEATYNRLLQVDKRVVIPVNTLVQVTVTSQDVIHSWAIPQSGIKYDAVPGRMVTFILNSNIEGIFYGQCSELCGVNHAFMPICIQALNTKDFTNWICLSAGINPSKHILNNIFVNGDILMKYVEFKWNCFQMNLIEALKLIKKAYVGYITRVYNNIVFNYYLLQYLVVMTCTHIIEDGTYIPILPMLDHILSAFSIHAEDSRRRRHEEEKTKEPMFDSFTKWLIFSMIVLYIFGFIMYDPRIRRYERKIKRKKGRLLGKFLRRRSFVVIHLIGMRSKSDKRWW